MNGTHALDIGSAVLGYGVDPAGLHEVPHLVT